MTILTEWLDFSGGGFCSWIVEMCERLCGGTSGFLLWQVLCVGPAVVAVVLCASESEGNWRSGESWNCVWFECLFVAVA
jgi:hypothetical protein